MLCGISIIGFLSSPAELLSPSSNLIEKRYFLSSLVVFLFYMSGALIVLSLESRTIIHIQPKKYVELPEIKETKESKEQNSESDRKNENSPVKPTGIKRFLRQLSFENFQFPSDEVPDIEEIKFYSPRNIVNNLSVSRRLNSLDISSKSTFEFQTQSPNKSEYDGKRTHISFIDDEIENIPNSKEPEITEKRLEEVTTDMITVEDTSNHAKLSFALKYRVFLTFFVAIFMESIPYSIILREDDISLYRMNIILLTIVCIPTVMYLSSIGTLLNKISYSKLLLVFLLINISIAISISISTYVFLPLELFIMMMII